MSGVTQCLRQSFECFSNLDLESCMWEFVSYYTLSELVNQCGGEIGIDGQVSRGIHHMRVSQF